MKRRPCCASSDGLNSCSASVLIDSYASTAGLRARRLQRPPAEVDLALRVS